MNQDNTPSVPERSVEEILDTAHWDYVCEKGISSIHTEKFPSAYKEQALIAMEKYAKQLLAASPQPKDASGMQWQQCPKCNGYGLLHVGVVHSEGQIDFTCDLCNGKKVIESPSAPSASTQQRERMFTLKEALEIYYDAQLFEYADNSKLYFKHKFNINL